MPEELPAAEEGLGEEADEAAMGIFLVDAPVEELPAEAGVRPAANGGGCEREAAAGGGAAPEALGDVEAPARTGAGGVDEAGGSSRADAQLVDHVEYVVHGSDDLDSEGQVRTLL